MTPRFIFVFSAFMSCAALLAVPQADAQDVPDRPDEAPQDAPDPEADEPGEAAEPVEPDEPAGEAEPTEEPPSEPAPPPSEPAGPAEGGGPTAARETACDDRRDDDGDGMVDCADADCFDDPVCAAGGSPERGNEACSDWIDNDGDGYIDCDDQDCQRQDVVVCEGSAPSARGARGTARETSVSGDEELPELEEGQSVEDLIGTHGDKPGEQNDYTCSDGIDNDNDGRTDCADFGCRFDPEVKVCSGTPGLRFSVVAGIGFTYDLEEEDASQAADVRFNRLQARVLGPVPYIEDSFFLLSMRLERTPRLTFALFQIPIRDKGHYLNVNSGSGSLSTGLIISASKHPLLDPPFYLFNAFEQGNGAAVEVGGPLAGGGMLRYRVFAAGGSGEFDGNVGGRFFRADNQNFTWATGAQLGLDIFGRHDRFDSPFLYTPVSRTLSFTVGAKYDQRARERYPAVNARVWMAYSHFLLRAESYSKYELEFGGFQTAYNVQATVLLVPKLLVFAADGGQYLPQEFDDIEDGEFGPNLQRPLEEWEARAALHLYWYRNVGLFSVLYREHHTEKNPDRPEDPTVEREVRAEIQFRF